MICYNCGKTISSVPGVGICCPFCEKESIPPQDLINPPHYKQHPSGIECITITEHMNFCLGNAIKYIWRSGLKDTKNPVEDLKKAKWYLEREIARIQNEIQKKSTY